MVAGLDTLQLSLQEVFVEVDQQVAFLAKNRVPGPISQAGFFQPRFAQRGKSKLKGMGPPPATISGESGEAPLV